MIDKISHIIKKASEIITVALLVVMLFVVLLQIFYRYFLGAALRWPEELARFLLVWVALVSFNILIIEEGNISVEIFKKRLPFKYRQSLEILLNIFKVIFVVIVLYYGYIYTTGSGLRVTTPGLGIKRAWVYAAIPIGAALMLIQLIIKTKQRIERLIKGEEG